MKTAAIQVSNSQLVNENVKVLKEGSSVFVKIVADKGNGKYSGIVSGVKVDVTSKNPLEVGASFKAVVSFSNGVIHLSPEKKASLPPQNSVTVLESKQLNQYLQLLGLYPDDISARLLKQLFQLKMNFNPVLINKLHSKAFKFAKNEKLAAEILMLLENNNEQFTEAQINLLLQALDFDETEESVEVIKKINNNSAWKFYPFELISLKNQEVVGSGLVKVLKDQNGTVKKIGINSEYKGEQAYFLINLNNNKIDKIYFNVSGTLNTDLYVEKLKGKLPVNMQNTTIEWTSADFLKGTGCELEQISILK